MAKRAERVERNCSKGRMESEGAKPGDEAPNPGISNL